MCNAKMGEVDLINHLLVRPKIEVLFFFDSILCICIASINALVIYKKLENNNFPLKKTSAERMIESFVSWKLIFPHIWSTKRNIVNNPDPNPPSNLPILIKK